MAKSRNVGLNIVITGDPKGAQGAMKVVGAEVTGLGQKMKGLATFVGGAAIVKWGADAVATFRSVGGEMLKLQRLTGASDEFVGGLWVGAQQSGVAIDKLTTSIGILSSKLNSKAVADLGINLKDAAGDARPFEEVLREIMDRFEQMENGAEKNLLARTLFGRSGTDLIPLLNKGSEALDGFIDRAAELGIELDAEAIKKATANQRDFNLSMTAAKVVIGEQLLPAVTGLTSFIARNLPTVVNIATSIGDAFNSLPGPVKALLVSLAAVAPAVKVFGTIAAPIRLLSNGLKVGSEMLTNFRLGLMGVTQAGAGASNAVGGFVNRIGGLGAAASLAGIAVVGVAGAMYGMQDDSRKAAERAANLRAEVDLLTSSAETLGITIAEAFEQQNLVKIWAEMGDVLLEGGITLDELRAGLTGTDEDFNNFLQANFSMAEIATGLNPLLRKIREQREALGLSKEQAERAADAKDELGIAEEGAADAIEGTTSAAKRQESVFERLNKVMDDRKGKVEAVWAAEDQLKSANENVAETEADLAEARRAAVGDSEEYRDATEAIVDAQEALADSHRGVTEAQERVNEAREAAADRLEELRRRVDELRESEERANLTTRQAQQAARDALADPTLTKLEKEDAQLKAKEAAQDERDLKAERADAARELAEAQRSGIDGDRDVVEAKQGVVEAERRVKDAADQVSEAQRRQREIIKEAKERAVEAEKRHQDAALQAAAAVGKVAEAQYGVNAGVLAHLGALDEWLAKIQPGSPLALALQQQRDDLVAIASLALVTQGLQQQAAGATDLPGWFGDAARLYQAATGGGGAQVSVYQQFQGTPAEQRAAMAPAAKAAFDRIAMGAG